MLLVCNVLFVRVVVLLFVVCCLLSGFDFRVCCPLLRCCVTLFVFGPFVVCCLLFAVRCVVSVVCWLMFFVYWLVGALRLSVCLLIVVCCLLFAVVVCKVLSVACCVMFDVNWSLCVVCWLLCSLSLLRV